MIKYFLILSISVMLAFLSGCGGKKTESTTVFIESGSVARVGTDEKIPVVVKDTTGKDHLEKRSIGGMVVMPKSTYDQLRTDYLKNSIQPAGPAPAPTPLTPATLSPPVH